MDGQTEEITDLTAETRPDILFVFHEHVFSDRTRDRRFRGAYRRREDGLWYHDGSLGAADAPVGSGDGRGDR